MGLRSSVAVINDPTVMNRGYRDREENMTYPRNASPAGADAERAAFLRDLRALRDQAGLQSQELAARAHYPEDTLKTAESGPALPTLPVLEAYVRACGARPAEWEERWRQIMQEPATALELPTRAPTAGRLPTRTAAFSSAADQGAIGPGLARVAAGLNPALTGSDAGSWFARPATTAAGSAAGTPASAAPAPPVPGPPVPGPSMSGPAAGASAERETAWRPAERETGWPSTGPETGRHRPEHETAWPPADPGTSWRASLPETTSRPAEREASWRPAEQQETWRPTGREASWRPMASETTWRPPAGGGPGTGPSPRPADSPPAASVPPFGPAEPVGGTPPPGTTGDRASGRKPTAPLDASALPSASRRQTTRRTTAFAVLSVVAILLVAALLWLALAS